MKSNVLQLPRARTTALALLVLLRAALVSAEPAPPAEPTPAPQSSVSQSSVSQSAPRAAWGVSRHTLENGLRVVLQEGHDTPNVAVCVTYDVGSRVETEGQSGLAHLFEHLMFQGSRHVEKGGHFREVAARGGRANATTNKERTNYFEVLPSNALPLALWLEADRMRGLALGTENFENQRLVVEEELRQRYDDKVFAHGVLRLGELVFQGDYAYEHPTIGSLEDLDALGLDWARDFHRRYYRPDNAVLSIVGDFDEDAALASVQQYFGDLAGAGTPPRFEAVSLPFDQASERFLVMVDEAASTPALLMGWSIPTGRSAERAALDLAAEVLAGGESGRLFQSLVIEKASALEVAAWTREQRDAGLFVVKTVVAPLSNVDTAQKWLDGEIKRLRFIGPSAEELDRARARLELQELTELSTNEGRAKRLGEYELFFGDASLLEADLGRYRAVSSEQVRKAAHEYLGDTRRSTVEIYPPGWTRDLGPVITTTTYVVQKGDTLIGIAKKHGTSADAIAKENRISTGRAIHPGQRLLVTLGSGFTPGPKVVVKKHEVKKGDTLSGIAHKYGTSADAIAKENHISTKKPIRPGQELTITVEVTPGKGKPSAAAKEPSSAGKGGKGAKPKTAPKAGTAPKAAPKKEPAPKAPAKPKTPAKPNTPAPKKK